jgi:murein L,D-transpeptidase YafK
VIRLTDMRGSRSEPTLDPRARLLRRVQGAAIWSACALAGVAFAQGSTATPVAASSVAAGVGAASVPSPATSTAPFTNEVEGALVRTLEILRDGGIKPALREIDSVLAKNPNFRLGHMLRGDLLMAKAGAPVALSGPIEARTPPEAATNIANLQHEARVRLTRYFDAPPEDGLPTALLQLAPHHEHAILVDVERSRLYVFRNVDGMPQRVIDFYTTIGKRGSEKAREGDQKTPLGVYHITSAVAKERLTDFYGPGAFPINFPNDVDRRLGRTGSGIWIHGTPPDTYSRPPWASDGCVVLTNDDFRKLVPFVDPGTTPVVIAPTVEWQPTQEWLAFRDSFGTQLSKWKQDWESLNMDSYLSHYSSRFDAEGKDLREWSTHKRRVNAQKSFVKVEIRNLSVFEYTSALNQPSMMMVTFDQDYRSSNNNTRMKKRQYWQREDGRWKIIFEGSAS